MKQIIITLSLIGIYTFKCYAQIEDPKEITPQILQKIISEVDKEAKIYEDNLSVEDLSKDLISFSLDTFKIEHIVSKRMDIDYSTAGMNNTMDERTKAYDVLLNRYYNKILKLLKPEDKKALINAQKAWIAYRDAEMKLISTLTKDEYSGGGTIQSNIASGAYSDLVVNRTIELFRYYDSILKE